MIKHTMTKFGLIVLTAALAVGTASAEEGEGLLASNSSVGNIAGLQRGAQTFFNYCSGCHSLKYMRYSRIAEDLNLSEEMVTKNLIFTDAKIGETALATIKAKDAENWFGKAPPDLSLEARAKSPDWIYTYLKSFYVDPSRPVGWNNTLFPGASMPNVLWELQGVQTAELAPAKPGEDAHIEKLVLSKPGKLSPQQYDETIRDLSSFLQYVGEPAALKREAVGVWVVLFLAFFTFIAWLLKTEYWKDVH